MPLVSPQPKWKLLTYGPQRWSGVSSMIFVWNQLLTPKAQTSETGSLLPDGGSWILPRLLTGSH